MYLGGAMFIELDVFYLHVMDSTFIKMALIKINTIQ